MKKMTWKSLGWLMMCLCALSFAACGDDGGDGEGGGGSSTDAKSKLVGTWTMEACSERNAPVGSEFTFASDGTGYSAAAEKTFVYTYTSDGSFALIYSNGNSISGKLIVSGDVASGTYSYSGSSTTYTFTFKKKASGGNDDSGGEVSVNLQNLVGTWQAIYAKGTSYDGIIDTKTLGGLDSLALPVLMVLNANQTFVSYNPQWEYPHGRHDNWPVYTWKKGDNTLPHGEGSFLLVAKQLQLIDNEYTLSMMIQSLTEKRLVVKYYYDGEDCTVTYGRDGDGADYFSGNSGGGGSSTDAKSKLVGTWTMTACSQRGAPVGSDFTFKSDGTGYYVEDGQQINFNYTYTSDGNFIITYDGGWRVLGTLNVSGNTASGTYSDEESSGSYTFTFKKKGGGSSTDAKSKLVGTWTMTACSERGAPVGCDFTFMSDGRGYYVDGDGDYVSFTYSLSSDGSFTMRFAEDWSASGTLNVSGSSASGTYRYPDSSSSYTFTFRKK